MKSSVPFLLLTILTPSASPLTFPDVIVLAAQKQLQRRRMPMTTGGSATENWTSDLGISTLHNVQLLASKVARASDTADAEVVDQSKPSTSQPGERVQLALKSLEQDMALLDEWVVERPQLSAIEFALLAGSVLAAGLGPLFLNLELTELLAPSAAACKSFFYAQHDCLEKFPSHVGKMTHLTDTHSFLSLTPR